MLKVPNKAILGGIVIAHLACFDVTRNEAKRQVNLERMGLGRKEGPQHVPYVAICFQSLCVHLENLSTPWVQTDIDPP